MKFALKKSLSKVAELDSELFELSRSPIIDDGNLETAFQLITESLSRVLNAQRVGIWLCKESPTILRCENLFEREKNEHSVGDTIDLNLFPEFFKAIANRRAMSVDYVEKNQATKDLLFVYFRHYKIKSILYAPISLRGEIIGFVTNEKTGHHFHWSTDQENFVASVSDFISRAILAKERICLEQDVEQMNSCFEEIVEARTKQLEDQKLKLFYSSKMASLGEMASGIAHEINNPLTIILGSTYLIKSLSEDFSEKNEMLQSSIERIIQTSFRIGKIIDGLRFFSKDADLNDPESLVLKEVLDDTLTLCKEKFKSRGCRLDVNVEAPDLKVYCQRFSLAQSLLNLLNNSFDAISTLPDKWISIDLNQELDKVIITITDSGTGIPKKYADKIMEPFFTTKPAGRGVGLGLSIVKGLIEKNNGHLTLDTQSKNTRFIIKLPMS